MPRIIPQPMAGRRRNQDRKPIGKCWACGDVAHRRLKITTAQANALGINETRVILCNRHWWRGWRLRGRRRPISEWFQYGGGGPGERALTDEQVQEIRRAYREGVTLQAIAEQYGVHWRTIWTRIRQDYTRPWERDDEA